MPRQETRKEAMELKNKLKSMSVGQVERLLIDIEKEAEGRLIEVFRKALNIEMKVGKKRFARVLYRVIKQLEGEGRSEDNSIGGT